MLNFADFSTLYGLAATLDMAFILVEGKNGDSYTSTIAYKIFNVEDIIKRLIPKKTKPKDSKLNRYFRLKSFSVISLYSFVFCFLCLLLAGLAGAEESTLPANYVFIWLSCIMSFLIVSGLLIGEQHGDFTRRKIKNDVLTIAHTDQKCDVLNKIYDDVETKLSKPVTNIFRNYLQCICMLCIIILFLSVMMVRTCFSRVQFEPRISPVVNDIAVILSSVVPFAHFFVFACIIRHRRNLLKICTFKSVDDIGSSHIRTIDGIMVSVIFSFCSVIPVIACCCVYNLFPGAGRFIALSDRYWLFYGLLFVFVGFIQFAYDLVYDNDVVINSGTKGKSLFHNNCSRYAFIHFLRVTAILICAYFVNIAGEIALSFQWGHIICILVSSFIASILVFFILHARFMKKRFNFSD